MRKKNRAALNGMLRLTARHVAVLEDIAKTIRMIGEATSILAEVAVSAERAERFKALETKGETPDWAVSYGGTDE